MSTSSLTQRKHECAARLSIRLTEFELTELLTDLFNKKDRCRRGPFGSALLRGAQISLSALFKLR